MTKWKFLSRKTLIVVLIFMLTSIFIPFVINLVTDSITWFRTRDLFEVTCTLDAWITIGSVVDNDLPELKLIYKDELVKNVLKVSWHIANTGTKGIEKFEKNPLIVYPERLSIVKAVVSSRSPSLKIDSNVLIDPEHRTIGINRIGVFNRNEFFNIDIYIIGISDTKISADYFDDWDFVAKGLDLHTEVEMASEPNREKSKGRYLWKVVRKVASTLGVIVLVFGMMILMFLGHFWDMQNTGSFENKLMEAEANTPSLSTSGKVHRITNSPKHQRLAEMARNSPRAAVVAAWDEILSAVAILASIYSAKNGENISHDDAILDLTKSNIVTKRLYVLYNSLHDMRKQIDLNRHSLRLSTSFAERYLNVALRFVGELQIMEENSQSKQEPSDV